VATLGACSGSSSSGGSPSASPTSSAQIGGPPLATAGAAGPNGKITAPVSNPPRPGVPGGSEVFPHVTQSAYRHLINPMKKLAGVRAVTYYPQFNQLQVYFDKGVTGAQRQAAYDYVAQHDPAAAPATTSASPAAS
jgi:hypothetical protein